MAKWVDLPASKPVLRPYEALVAAGGDVHAETMDLGHLGKMLVVAEALSEWDGSNGMARNVADIRGSPPKRRRLFPPQGHRSYGALPEAAR